MTLQPTYCDRCSGNFAKDKHRLTCRTCGAGKHWEQGCDPDTWIYNTPPGVEYQIVKTRHGVKHRTFRPKPHPITGETQPTYPLSPGMGPTPRTPLIIRLRMEATPSLRWVSAKELAAKFEQAALEACDIEEEELDTQEFLEMESSFIEKLTGGNVGRPRTGFDTSEDIATAVRVLLEVSGYWLLKRWAGLYTSERGGKGTGPRLARNLWFACLNEYVNTEAIAVRYGKDARTIRRYSEQGRQWIRNNLLLLCLTVPKGTVAPLPNLPKEGRDMNAAVAFETLDVLKDIRDSMLRQEFRQLDEEERRQNDSEGAQEFSDD
jgi:hypothetical protein